MTDKRVDRTLTQVQTRTRHRATAKPRHERDVPKPSPQEDIKTLEISLPRIQVVDEARKTPTPMAGNRNMDAHREETTGQRTRTSVANETRLHHRGPHVSHKIEGPAEQRCVRRVDIKKEQMPEVTQCTRRSSAKKGKHTNQDPGRTSDRAREDNEGGGVTAAQTQPRPTNPRTGHEDPKAQELASRLRARFPCEGCKRCAAQS